MSPILRVSTSASRRERWFIKCFRPSLGLGTIASVSASRPACATAGGQAPSAPEPSQGVNRAMVTPDCQSQPAGTLPLYRMFIYFRYFFSVDAGPEGARFRAFDLIERKRRTWKIVRSLTKEVRRFWTKTSARSPSSNPAADTSPVLEVSDQSWPSPRPFSPTVAFAAPASRSRPVPKCPRIHKWIPSQVPSLDRRNKRLHSTDSSGVI